MTAPRQPDLSAFSLLDLFRSEAENQVQILSENLLALERDAQAPGHTSALMRAAHSIKGAAAIVDLPLVVTLAHAMEDAFVASQQSGLPLSRAKVDTLLEAIDMLAQIASLSDSDAPTWFDLNGPTIRGLAASIADAAPVAPAETDAAPSAAGHAPAMHTDGAAEPETMPSSRSDQSLKVNVEHLDRLLALTSAAVVSAHKRQPFLQSMQRLKRKQFELFGMLDELQQALVSGVAASVLKTRTQAILHAAAPLKLQLVERLAELESHERTLMSASQTTLDEVLALRMRPFREGVVALPRMVRDLAHQLGKEVRLDIDGGATLIDRDVLASIESPLHHLLRNAIDHGMEPPDQREAAGKPRSGTIRISARHAGGMLHLEIGDDGQGVDTEMIRRRIVERGMVTESMAMALSQAELLDFLFLPAFSLKQVTNLISGRGVGLDVVHETVRRQYGTVRLESRSGRGFTTRIVLPLTQSVVRSLVAQIGDDAYAVPIAKIERVQSLDANAIHLLENKPFFRFEDELVGLIELAQVLGLPAGVRSPDILSVIVLGGVGRRHALVVDAIVGEVCLAVQPLDATFGKLRDIAAGALLDNGLPVLILDVDDLLLSIDKLLGAGRLHGLPATTTAVHKAAKRVLVVDDSLTVREMERNLLQARGFEVDVAVDGVDGWNAIRSKHYDLLITDVDMPRMDGIELVTLVRKDARLQALPVMIVSYKDRPEDRSRGIHAGADYYLTKGSFHDETLLDAVIDLIGEASA